MALTLPVELSQRPAGPSVPARLGPPPRPKTARAATIAAGAAAALGMAGARLAASGRPAAVLAFPALLLPLVLWRWRSAGVVVLLAAATLVEQVTYTVGPGVGGAITQKVPLFHSITKGSGINLGEVLIVVILLFWVVRSALDKTLVLPRSALTRSLTAFLLLVMTGFGVGLARHGQVRWAVWEVRPWFYLGAAYLLASSTIRTTRALRALPWTLVIGSGIKAVQGIIIWVPARRLSPRPEAILAHEEAFFFGLFLFLVLGLWIYNIRGPLRRTSTALAPVVLLANLANSRRNSWAILALGTVAILVIAYRNLPERRPSLRRLALVLAVGSAAYFPAFWNGDGTIAQPARALHSSVKPDQRDLSSNLYRVQEDANLTLDIRRSHDIGTGFGIPIVYDLPITDISGQDSMIKYIPHNSVLYLWMRLGIQGEVAFLLVLATAVLQATRLARSADRELALLGTLVVAAIIAYVVQGYNDMGFTWFRIALCMGVLLGATEAALRLASEATHPGAPGPDRTGHGGGADPGLDPVVLV